MYKDWTQNYDPEIHNEYLMILVSFFAKSFIAIRRLQYSYIHNQLD